MKNFCNRIQTKAKLNKLIEQTVENCLLCQIHKHRASKLGFVVGDVTSKLPNIKVSSDIIGPFNYLQKAQGIYKKTYIVTFTDACTRYTEIKFIDEITSVRVTNTFNKLWLQRHGIPKHVHTDLGRQYTGKTFNALLQTNNITHSYSTANNPTSNSRSERINKSINEIMRMYSTKLTQKNLETIIWKRLNLNINRTTGFSPYELFFSQDFITKENSKGNIIEIANERTRNANKKNLHQINAKRKQYQFLIGEEIFKRVNRQIKSDPIWEGPFQIIKISNDNQRFTLRKGNMETKVNIKHLRPKQLKKGRMSYLATMTPNQ